MAWWSTARTVGATLGVWNRPIAPLGCTLGQTVYAETKRAAQIANLFGARQALDPATVGRLRPVFPAVDLDAVRVHTRCRLPSNRFRPDGSIYAMTFGTAIFWRDDLDADDPEQLVRLIHELVHVDQVRRFGGERSFACEYGRGYLQGGGQLPAWVEQPTAYHRNPLEAEAYTFEARFRGAVGDADPALLPA
jgi:hypothetical protein